jgi:hypothetical protein
VTSGQCVGICIDRRWVIEFLLWYVLFSALSAFTWGFWKAAGRDVGRWTARKIRARELYRAFQKVFERTSGKTP